MAVVNLTATRRGIADSVPGHGGAGSVIAQICTVEVGSADSATSTYDLGDFPSNARIMGASTVYWDDLASTGSPTLDFGFFDVNSNITDDDDALNDGMDAASVNSTGLPLIKDKANYGKRAWEFVNGQTSDPGGLLQLKATLKDADVNEGGTLTVEVLYIID